MILPQTNLRGQTAFQGKRALMIGAQLSQQWNRGDWAQHFYDQWSVGAELGWKNAQDWIFSAEGNYAFGNQINDPDQYLNALQTSNGQVLNLNGSYATYTVYQRGAYGSGNVEKILPFWKATLNSGPTIGLGAGYYAHWIRIDNAGNDVPLFNDEYEKGFDQWSHGPMLKESIGYLYLSRNRRINFKISLEIAQIFSQNIRGYNYSTGQKESGTQNNWLYGLKLNWYIPVYRGAPRQEYYYD